MWRHLSVLTAAAAALALLWTGCDAECSDRFDCEQGADFACVEGRCVAPASAGDAGVGPDPEDGGADGGHDAGRDAGPVDAGPDCTGANTSCTGPFRCVPNPDGGTGRCEALWVGVTQALPPTTDGGLILNQATLVRFNDVNARVSLGEAGASTRQPRFSGDGTRVAWVWEPGTLPMGVPQIRQQALPVDGGFEVVVSAAPDGGVDTFTQLEYAPADALVWTTVKPMNTRDGVQYAPGDGGAVVQVSPTGGYPDWAPQGTQIAFDDGPLKQYAVSTGQVTNLTSDTLDTLPQYAPGGDWVLFQRKLPYTDPLAEFSGELWVVPSSGGTPAAIETRTLPTGTAADGGTVGTYVQYPAWGATSDRLAWTRVTWFFDPMGAPVICNPTIPLCGGTEGQQIFTASFDPATGTAGIPVPYARGIHPSISPDGNWLAWIDSDGLGGQVLRVAPLAPDGSLGDAGTPIAHPFPQLVADDLVGRPRWQPKP